MWFSGQQSVDLGAERPSPTHPPPPTNLNETETKGTKRERGMKGKEKIGRRIGEGTSIANFPVKVWIGGQKTHPPRHKREKGRKGNGGKRKENGDEKEN